MRDENKLLKKWKNLNHKESAYNETPKFTTLNLRLRVLKLNTMDIVSWIILCW